MKRVGEDFEGASVVEDVGVREEEDSGMIGGFCRIGVCSCGRHGGELGSVKTVRSRMLVMIYRLNEREEEVLSVSFCGVFF